LAGGVRATPRVARRPIADAARRRADRANRRSLSRDARATDRRRAPRWRIFFKKIKI
jgi:hypothetical protein